MRKTLLSWLGLDIPPVIGVEMSSYSVKMIEMYRASRQQLGVLNYSKVALPYGAVQDSQIQDRSAVIDTLKKAYNLGGYQTRHIALSIPTNEAILFKLVLPKGLPEDELSACIAVEIPKYVPYSIEEVYYDFYVNEKKEQKTQSISVAVCKKNKVDDLVQLCHESELDPLIVDIEAYALERSFKYLFKAYCEKNKDSIIGFVNVSATDTILIIFLNGEMIYHRSEAFGGNHLTQEISRHFSLKYEEAESFKKEKENEKNNQDYIENVLNPYLIALSQEVQRLLEFFYSSSDFQKIDRLFCSGGTVYLPGAIQNIEKTVGVPSNEIDFFKNLIIKESIKSNFMKDAHQFFMAIGLSLRGVY